MMLVRCYILACCQVCIMNFYRTLVNFPKNNGLCYAIASWLIVPGPHDDSFHLPGRCDLLGITNAVIISVITKFDSLGNITSVCTVTAHELY